MAAIRHQLAIQAPLNKVYAALSTPEAISRWWDQQTPVQTPQGLVMEHNPGPQHGIVQLLVVQQIPTKSIEWKCISEHPSTSPAAAWTGTHFTFELTDKLTPAAELLIPAEKRTQPFTTINFAQTNYKEESPFFAFNNWAWAQVLNSLKSHCES